MSAKKKPDATPAAAPALTKPPVPYFDHALRRWLIMTPSGPVWAPAPPTVRVTC